MNSSLLSHTLISTTSQQVEGYWGWGMIQDKPTSCVDLSRILNLLQSSQLGLLLEKCLWGCTVIYGRLEYGLKAHGPTNWLKLSKYQRGEGLDGRPPGIPMEGCCLEFHDEHKAGYKCDI